MAALQHRAVGLVLVGPDDPGLHEGHLEHRADDARKGSASREPVELFRAWRNVDAMPDPNMPPRRSRGRDRDQPRRPCRSLRGARPAHGGARARGPRLRPRRRAPLGHRRGQGPPADPVADAAASSRARSRAPSPTASAAKATAGSWEAEDPYRFGPVMGEMDEYLLGEGTHRRIWQALGAHVRDHEGIPGTHFAVWAPNARARLGRGRLQPLGRPPRRDAAARRHRRVGDLLAPCRRRRAATSTRSSASTA